MLQGGLGTKQYGQEKLLLVVFAGGALHSQLLGVLLLRVDPLPLGFDLLDKVADLVATGTRLPRAVVDAVSLREGGGERKETEKEFDSASVRQANSPNDLIIDQDRGALLHFVFVRPLDTLAQEFSAAFAIDAVLLFGVPICGTRQGISTQELRLRGSGKRRASETHYDRRLWRKRSQRCLSRCEKARRSSGTGRTVAMTRVLLAHAVSNASESMLAYIPPVLPRLVPLERNVHVPVCVQVGSEFAVTVARGRVLPEVGCT